MNTGRSPRPAGISTDATPHYSAASAEAFPEWRRFRFLRCWIWLQLPVVTVMSASIAVFAAMTLSANNYDILPKLFEELTPHGEANVPSWINAGLWMIFGLVAGYIATRVQQHRFSWTAVSLLGFYFSFDETVQVHERLDDDLTVLEQFLPVATYVWIIPGALFVLMVVGLLLRMVLSLPQRSRVGLLTGGAVFVLGSLAMETFEGTIYFGQGLNSTSFIISGIVEETCEMTGVALAIAAMLHLIEWRHADGATAYRVNVQRDTDLREHS